VLFSQGFSNYDSRVEIRAAGLATPGATATSPPAGRDNAVIFAFSEKKNPFRPSLSSEGLDGRTNQMYTTSEHLNEERAAMKATFLDLRKRSKEIVKALDRNQSVTLFYRGKPKGVILPAPIPPEKTVSAMSHRAFGMWRDRADLKDIGGYVAKLRKTRHAL
jgi:hypothetical protein